MLIFELYCDCEGKSFNQHDLFSGIWVAGKVMIKQAIRMDCGSCDHATVSGVACDGQFDAWCEYLEVHRGSRSKQESTHRLYLVEVADLAAPGEFDAVRSET